MLTFRSDKPLTDFARREAEYEAWLAKRPVCADCEQHIQDEWAYYINGEWICEDCMESYKQAVWPE